MSLDDRLKRAFDGLEADTDRRVSDRVADGFTPSPSTGTGRIVVSVVAVAAVLIAGWLALPEDGPVTVTPAEPTSLATTAPPQTTPTTSAPGTTEPPPVTASSTTGGVPTSSTPTTAAVTSTDPATTAAQAGSDNTTPPQTAPTTTSVTPTTPSTPSPTNEATTTQPPTTVSSSTQPSSIQPPVDQPAGVPNSVCASGLRVPLERATLSYVGESEGWGRLDDLVDEQDGPFYFEAWEPGFPDVVTVRLVLAEPMGATALMVAQDPFTPVSGDIVIGGDLSGTIGLSGTDGWKSLVFADPIEVSQLTITRSQPEANIMEVLLCTG